MPGILTLYTTFADSLIQLYESKGKVKKISRAKVEHQLLSEIEKAKFPIEYKLSWYRTVLVSSNFEAFWISASIRHRLPKSCTARFDPDPDQNLLEYEAPTDDETRRGLENEIDHEGNDGAEEGIPDENHNHATVPQDISPISVSQTPALVTDHNSRSSTPDPDHSSRTSSSDIDPEQDTAALLPIKRTIPKCDKCNARGHATRVCPENADDQNIDWSSDASSQCIGGHEGKMLAKRLGAGLPRGTKPVSNPLTEPDDLYQDSRAVLGDSNGLAREEGDDGEYQETPSKRKGKSKVKATLGAKEASQPKGVVKAKSMPKKKEQTAAQLKTAAAKTREPAKPKATRPSPTTPGQAATTPAPLSNGTKEPSRASTEPDEVDKTIAQIQAKMAPAQEQGIKRMWAQFPDDGDDAPATKKAKTAVPAGRKKATPKKGGLQEWDGVHRGFGEYYSRPM